MWLIADYAPSALFSLKVGTATSSGAKTLFLPTPFAIRNALLDVGLRLKGQSQAEQLFELIKGLQLAVSPPGGVVVTNLFAKVLKPPRKAGGGGEESSEEAETAGTYWTSSIAFREYAYLQGDFSIAFAGSEQALELAMTLTPQINYFGKRGSFFQWLGCRQETVLPASFIRLDQGFNYENGRVINPPGSEFPLGVIQLMDDWGENLTWSKANIYSDERLKSGDRVRHSVIFPYRLLRSSRNFSYYERLG